jgi:hypothetical protein
LRDCRTGGESWTITQLWETLSGPAVFLSGFSLFVDETNSGSDEALEYLAALPIRVRLELAERLQNIVHSGIGQVLAPEYAPVYKKPSAPAPAASVAFSGVFVSPKN